MQNNRANQIRYQPSRKTIVCRYGHHMSYIYDNPYEYKYGPNAWPICDIGKKELNPQEGFWHCYVCNYDMCWKCCAPP